MKGLVKEYTRITQTTECIRLKQIKVWPCEERALHGNGSAGQAYKGEMVLALEPHDSVSPCAHLRSPEFAQTSSEPSKKFHQGPGWLQPEDSSTGQELGRVGKMELGRWGWHILPGLCHRREVLGPGKKVLVGNMGHGLSIGMLAIVLQSST